VSIFHPVDSKLFFTRNDPKDPRLGDLAKALPDLPDAEALFDTMTEVQTSTAAERRNFVLAGYPDDEGIRLNGGRLGAAAAPTEIRRSLYKMTPPPYAARETATLWDLGDLRVSEFSSLESRHQAVSSMAGAALRAGSGWIGLGGGHDYGFADADAFCEWAKTRAVRPLVVNFDAHLDVRPTSHGLTSGTPFYRMLEKHPETDFAEIGIQSQCTSRGHLEWVKARGARVLAQEELEVGDEPMVTAVTRLLGDWLLRPRPVFLSIDIDGFSSAVAPGCSQSWATGFMPADFFPVLNLLVNRLDVRVLGLYEVSPPLDSDLRTAKLAAQIVHRVIS